MRNLERHKRNKPSQNWNNTEWNREWKFNRKNGKYDLKSWKERLKNNGIKTVKHVK